MSPLPVGTRQAGASAIRQAKTILRTARHATLATLAGDGSPAASRVALATLPDGSPLILISGLASHTAALRADPRCALLVGDIAEGDAMAQPRLSIQAKAEPLSEEAGAEAKRRFVSHAPAAELYADLPDFRYLRLATEKAFLNGGFGKAFALTSEDLLSTRVPDLEDGEAAILAHMNEDHRGSLAHYARSAGLDASLDWTMTGLDSEGFQIAAGDHVARIWFPSPLENRADARRALVALAG